MNLIQRIFKNKKVVLAIIVVIILFYLFKNKIALRCLGNGKSISEIDCYRFENFRNDSSEAKCLGVAKVGTQYPTQSFEKCGQKKFQYNLPYDFREFRKPLLGEEFEKNLECTQGNEPIHSKIF